MSLPDLTQTDHRSYPPPRAPWVMRMTWLNLLFMHWPVPAAALRPHIPDDLVIDTYTGGPFVDQAFIGVVPFRMAGTRGRCLPPVPSTHNFLELNVRTYVRAADGRPGVWFFSLDAESRLAVETARITFRLPYLHARMSCSRRDDGWICYRSSRTDRRGAPAEFDADYRPTAPPALHGRGSLEYFLTERYCLYAPGRNGRSLRAEIHHPQWPLSPATATVRRNTMVAPLGIDLASLEVSPGSWPLLHFVERMDVVAWPVHPVPS